MSSVKLSGCSPVPLAHFLKGLGIFRLFSEQENPEATSSWSDDELTIFSDSKPAEIVDFLASAYRPTAIVAPWNGGSGFYANDNALEAIEKGKTPRLELYRHGIAAALNGIKSLKLKSKPEGEAKAALIQQCRNNFPDDALDWLDAVLVLGSHGPKFPPLLGTGGNDGRLEFTNNFMQRIVEVMDPKTGEATSNSRNWLKAALFGNPSAGLTTKAPIGQFFPGAAGGANSTSGFEAPSAVNPWDFILMIEGALLFAGAAVKRLESEGDGTLVYPFCVRQAGVGYASAAPADEVEARCEMWMPLWNQPATLSELKAILNEGRAHVRGRAARNGVDFAKAAVTLGVERGISEFQRYGFQVRNGLAYFATPLERVRVKRNIRVDLLSDIEAWHDRLRQKAGPRASPPAPASVSRALNQIERRILELCKDDSPERLESIVAALGAGERALARSMKWSKASFLKPLSGLRPEWLEQANSSIEFRLAQSLAGTRAILDNRAFWLRQNLEPVSISGNKERSWADWNETAGNDVAWREGNLTDALNGIFARRLIQFEKAGARGWPDWSPRPASLEDISAFIEGYVDEDLLADLIWGLSLLNWGKVAPTDKQEVWEGKDEDRAVPSSFYAMVRLCFRLSSENEQTVPVNPAILNRAISGDGAAAADIAARRLKASGKAPLVRELPVMGEIARRTAAAVLFPIAASDYRVLEKQILHKPKEIIHEP